MQENVYQGTDMLKKNDELELYIEDMSVDGAGIGKTPEGLTLFVKDAVVGDRVVAHVTKLKKHYGFARLMSVKVASSWRVEPACPFARPCGGCQIQELSYEKQLEFKQNKVKNDLVRIGGFQAEKLPMEPVVGMEHPWHYRNKAQFPAGTDKEGNPITGFYAGRTHRIIANDDCALGVPVNQKILQIVLFFMKKHHISAYDEKTGKGMIRHILIRCGFHSGEIMVTLVVNAKLPEIWDSRKVSKKAILSPDCGSGELPGIKGLPHLNLLADQLFKLPGMTSFCLNGNTRKNNVILGDEICIVRGQEYITDQIGGISYQISPKSFFQVNPVQTEKLYSLALEYAGLTGQETVWDLYCGIGTISLFLAQKAKKLYGVEIIPEAVENAKNNARLNGISNAVFYVGKAEEILPAFYRKEQQAGRLAHADVIVVDPPRKGCDEKLLQTMLGMQPERIVYVSCGPATLARDLKILCEGGYEVKRIRPVDMFPQTVHVETVVLLSNTRKKPYVTLDVDMDDYYRIKAESEKTEKTAGK